MTIARPLFQKLLEKGSDADLLRAMLEGTVMSSSQVSRLCEDIDKCVQTLLSRQIEGVWPYVWPYMWMDAMYLKVR